MAFTMDRHGDYGYDAPYALLMFAALAVACAIGAIVAWASGNSRPAAILAFYGAFFLFNALSFLLHDQEGQVRGLAGNPRRPSAAW